MLWHVLGYFGVYPVAVHALWCDDQDSIDAALVVKHCYIIDEHEALARSHIGEQCRYLVIPKALKVSSLMRKRLVFESVSL